MLQWQGMRARPARAETIPSYASGMDHWWSSVSPTWWLRRRHSIACLTDSCASELLGRASRHTPTLSKHHAISMDLPGGREGFPAKGHDISPLRQCSLWYHACQVSYPWQSSQTHCPSHDNMSY